MFGRDRSTKLEKHIKDNYERIIKIQSRQSEAILDVLEQINKQTDRFEGFLPANVTNGGKEDWVASINETLGKIDSGVLDDLIGDDAEGKAVKIAIKTLKKPLSGFLEKRKDILNPILSSKLEGLALKLVQKRETPPERIER